MTLPSTSPFFETANPQPNLYAVSASLTYQWDVGSLTWVKGTQPTGGGGGGAVTIADGANVVEGATTDAAVTSNAAGTLSAKLRGLVAILADVWDSVNHRLKVDGSGVTQPVSGSVSVSNFPATQPVSGTVAVSNFPASQAVTGTFFQATQPVSIAASVAVTGPLTDAQLRATAVPVSGTFFQATQPVSLAVAPTTPVTGTFFQTTQPVSVASLPLPTGAALEAGNLATLVSLLTIMGQLVEGQKQELAVLRMMNIQLANMTGTGGFEETLGESLIQ